MHPRAPLSMTWLNPGVELGDSDALLQEILPNIIPLYWDLDRMYSLKNSFSTGSIQSYVNICVYLNGQLRKDNLW